MDQKEFNGNDDADDWKLFFLFSLLDHLLFRFYRKKTSIIYYTLKNHPCFAIFFISHTATLQRRLKQQKYEYCSNIFLSSLSYQLDPCYFKQDVYPSSLYLHPPSADVFVQVTDLLYDNMDCGTIFLPIYISLSLFSIILSFTLFIIIIPSIIIYTNKPINIIHHLVYIYLLFYIVIRVTFFCIIIKI
ncbi:hypothetical protein BDA99DRAFT_495094 [Phascolomyces articulosus]|uniref:Uncharacterized protein n=1 Tax=Phascolomyces articulosus TaxID=60185 RepID=A0AAD5PIX0_9FUNG|nr:hypothetical protein BDA99DRAFT_495094 [Phascolomyces articulosus]